MMEEKIKVTLLTGFLGAGKTTLLNNLLGQHRADRNMVIENEFGSVSIDSGIVSLPKSDIFELNNGCICCTLGAELYEVLCQMANTSFPPQNVFIEASGVADPGALASVFRQEAVSKYFEVRKVVCVVDAENCEDSLREIPEAGRQLAIADLVVINKIDAVAPDYLRGLEKMIRQINPLAYYKKTRYGQLSIDELRASPKSQVQLLDNQGRDSDHQHSDLKSVVLRFDGQVFEKESFQGLLTISLFIHYHQIYRVKGYVNFYGSREQFLVQSVGKQVYVSPVRMVEPRSSVIVVIGKDITQEGLMRLFKKAFVSESKSNAL